MAPGYRLPLVTVKPGLFATIAYICLMADYGYGAKPPIF